MFNSTLKIPAQADVQKIDCPTGEMRIREGGTFKSSEDEGVPQYPPQENQTSDESS